MLQSFLRNSSKVCTRHLHYIVQRDTNKIVPKNHVFVITEETAPILQCLNLKECEEKLKDIQPVQLLNATFVLDAVNERKKLRKMRGVTTMPSKLRDITILAVCPEDTHPEAYEQGATHCLAPEQIDQITPTMLEQYETVVCSTSAFPYLTKAAKILRNKMPHERKGTVSVNIGSAVRTGLQAIEWEMVQSSNHQDFYNVTVPICKSNYPATTIDDHLTVILEDIMKHKPAKQNPEDFLSRVELVWDKGSLHLDIRKQLSKHKVQEVTILKKRYTREETRKSRAEAEAKQPQIDDEREKLSRELQDRWSRLQSS